MSKRTQVATLLAVLVLIAAMVVRARSREVEVRVLDASTQRGIPGAVVSLRADNEPERIECSTGPEGEGRCRIPKGLAFTVDSSAPGYHRAEAWLGAEEEQLVLLLRRQRRAVETTARAQADEAEPRPALPSRVLDEQDRPLAGVTASLTVVALDEMADLRAGPLPISRLAETKSDARGEYRFELAEWPRASIVVLTLSAEGYEPFSINVDSVRALQGRSDRLKVGGRWLELDVVDAASGRSIPSAAGSCRVGSAGALFRFDSKVARPWRFRASAQESVSCSGWAQGYLLVDYTVDPRRDDRERIVLELMRTTGAVLGTVVGAEDGLPISGARVEVLSEGGSDTGVTDASGNYQLGPDLSMTGRLLLRVSRPGQEAALKMTDVSHEPSGGEFDISREADHIRVDVRLDSSSSICGMVRSSRGEPIEGAKVVATSGLGVSPTVVRSASSQADGSYCVQVRSMVSYSLEARHPDYAPHYTGDVEVPRNGSVNVDFVLHDAVQISGVVLAPNGAPVEGALLRAVQQELRLGLQAVSAADGTFVLEAVPPGRYSIAAAHTPHSLTGPDVEVEVKPGYDRSGVVVYTLGQGSFSGRVSVEGEAPGELFVWYVGGGYSRETAVPIRDDGRYVVENLEPAEYQVQVAAAGYARTEPVTVKVSDGRETPGIDWNFASGYRLTGRVREAGTQTPVAGATVEFFRISHEADGPTTKVADNLRSGIVQADEQGAFVLQSLPKGQYLVQSSANRLAPATALVSLQADSEVMLEMGAGGVLVVQARDESGGPPHDALCLIEREQHGDLGQSQTLPPDGSCVFESLPSGGYIAEVHFRPPFGTPGELKVVEARVNVLAGQASTIELRPDSGRVRPVR